MTTKRLSTLQNFTLTASSQASVDFGAQTYRVRVACGSTLGAVGGAYIMFGDTTALTISSTNGHFFPAGWAEDFDVVPGQTFYTIEYTTAHGVVSLTELT
jgi:hypothetical protein